MSDLAVNPAMFSASGATNNSNGRMATLELNCPMFKGSLQAPIDSLELGSNDEEAGEEKKGITLANVLTVIGLGAAAYFCLPKAVKYVKNLFNCIRGVAPKTTAMVLKG